MRERCGPRTTEQCPLGCGDPDGHTWFIASVNNKYVDPDGEFLNFAAKFVLDVGVNIAFNYATSGSFGVGAALKESAVGILNPAKTVAKVGKLASVLAKTGKSTKAAGEAVQQLRKSDEVIHVTKAGVALLADPKYKIPDGHVQNTHTHTQGRQLRRIVNGERKERLCIDRPTPAGMKGPNYSHYHKEGKGAHYSPANGNRDPGFQTSNHQP